MEKCFFKKIELAAKRGDYEAMRHLAASYETGSDGLEKDAGKAVYWLEKVAELNDAWALYNLGLRYEEGRGVPKCGEKALSLFVRAHSIGSSYASQRLGLIYETGKCANTTVNIDLNAAGIYWLASADQGDFWSKIHVARMYEKGSGLTQDTERSDFWYNSAEEQLLELDDQLSISNLINLAESRFIPAIELLVKGYKSSMYGLDQDESKSFDWEQRLTFKQ